MAKSRRTANQAGEPITYFNEHLSDRFDRLPANYVASIENGKLLFLAVSWYSAKPTIAINANAIYDYSAASEEEMDLQSGKSYKIVDRSESDWWKAEDNGRCALVPAMYFEVDGSQ